MVPAVPVRRTARGATGGPRHPRAGRRPRWPAAGPARSAPPARWTRSTRPSRSGSSGSASAGTPGEVRRARARASNRVRPASSTSSPAAVGPSAPTRADVAVGGAHVPPPPPVAVGVGGRTDAPVVALLPVEMVVAALVAGSGPVGDLLPAGSRRRRAPRRPSRSDRPGRRRPGGGPGPAASGVPGSTVRA